MSKQAIIGINGGLVPFSETVDKLRTPGIGGSDITWVPEDQTRCEALHVTANGTYAAASAGKYGYNYVTVSVAGDSVTGKDGDGDEATATPDPETGIIEYNKIPSRIEITTQPTKLTYNEGQAIDFTGAVVKAYFETGGEWGVVQNGEITLNPTVAIGNGQYEATSDLDTGAFTQPIPISGSVTYAYTNSNNIRFSYSYTPMNSGVLVVMINKTGTTKVLYASPSSQPALLVTQTIITSQGEERKTFTQHTPNHVYTASNKTVHYGWLQTSWPEGTNHVINPEIDSYGSNDTTGATAWTVVYGNITAESDPITVNWPRPGDGAILETSFNITVTPASQEG